MKDYLKKKKAFWLCDFIWKIISVVPSSLMSDLGNTNQVSSPVAWALPLPCYAIWDKIKRAPLWASECQSKNQLEWVRRGVANHFRWVAEAEWSALSGKTQKFSGGKSRDPLVMSSKGVKGKSCRILLVDAGLGNLEEPSSSNTLWFLFASSP